MFFWKSECIKCSARAHIRFTLEKQDGCQSFLDLGDLLLQSGALLSLLILSETVLPIVEGKKKEGKNA